MEEAFKLHGDILVEHGGNKNEEKPEEQMIA
jgi:hypothetical protein